MLPSITILGKNVPTYGLCAALGLMLFVLLFKREDKHCPEESADVELGFVYGLLGAALGAKLLFLLTGLPALWADRALLFSDTARFLETYVLSGFVFYGGLYGALCGVLLYGKKAGASGSMLLPLYIVYLRKQISLRICIGQPIVFVLVLPDEIACRAFPRKRGKV